MKKVLIINEGFSDNFGDQAIVKSMSLFFQDNHFKADFLYFSKPSMQNLPNYNYKSHKVKPVSKPSVLKGLLYIFYWVYVNRKVVVSKLKNNHYDIVVIGGGQLINTSGKIYPSAFATSLFWMTRYIMRYTTAKKYLVAVGCAKRFGFIEKLLYKKAIKNIDKVWVRDNFSERAILEVFNKKSVVIPDIAFYNSLAKMLPIYEKQNIALIGITSFQEVFLKYNKEHPISKKAYYEQYYQKIQEYRGIGFDPILFYTTITDALECKAFQQYLYKEYKLNVKIAENETLEALLDSFKKANVIFSARMHALILGIKYKCKVEPYLISEKLKSFNKDYIQSNKTIEMFSSEIENKLKPILNDE